MIKISGLPVQITKADLDEIFSPYGAIQITEDSVVIQIGESESTARVLLDQGEAKAIEELSNTIWQGKYLLYLDVDRVPPRRGQSKSGGNKPPKKRDEEKQD